jgi:hypothetical protein
MAWRTVLVDGVPMWTYDEGFAKRRRRLFFEVPRSSRVEVPPESHVRSIHWPPPPLARPPARPSGFDLELFELREGFTVAELQHAYRLLARDAHPDRGGDPVEFVGITEARDRLLPFARRG